jgi:ATP-dependent Lhr-like helicase
VKNRGKEIIVRWLADKGLQPFAFQEETWQLYGEGRSGIVNAPTGFGKTFSVFLAVVIDWLNEHPELQSHKSETYQSQSPVQNRKPEIRNPKSFGLQLLWVTPLRALAKDIGRAMEMALEELGIPWRVAVRNGDTSTAERQKQKANAPEILIITPESLQLLLASKNAQPLFKSLKCIAVDEWHELLGSKRGVQVELALSRIKALLCLVPSARCQLRIWGISATIGNLEEAMHVLLGNDPDGIIVRSKLEKKIKLHTVLPDTVERFPWAGHLGNKMVDKVLPIIHQSRSTLLFTNVRSQAEIWYQTLLDADPDLAGVIALHHSAIDGELRTWVEEQLHLGTLKVVVCTASLDLGVDFRPVDTVIQVGSPKGVARFLQRAGRSGHAPNEVSNIYFVPTHSLEIVEGAALEEGYRQQLIESRQPVMMAFDVLIQYMVTLAVGDGFKSEELYGEVVSTHCFADVTWDEWEWMLAFITTGGSALNNYDEYHKVGEVDGVYRVMNRRIAMRHRMNIGTIVGDALMRVKFMGGGFVGTIEESFISRLNIGDVFILAGKKLELVMVRDMDALVRKSKASKAIVPAWMGGRLPLSANLGSVLRATFNQASEAEPSHPLIQFLRPLFAKQEEVSHIPSSNETLVELIQTRDGYHLFVYPFEGRLVHQSLASLLAYRISLATPISFSIAMNDYGFELLSDQPIPVDERTVKGLFDPHNWYPDLQRSINAVELVRRKFRDIAVISGLLYQNYFGEFKKQRHLQNSTSLIYQVLVEHEPNSLLLQQAYNEVLAYEVEVERMHQALERIYKSDIVITRPQNLTPFCFPIAVDSLSRNQLSSEKLEDRIRRMQVAAEKG